MSIEIDNYKIDFSALSGRDQYGNAVDGSIDIFKDKTVYLGILKAFVDEVNELYVALVELAKERNIAYANGVWLDGLGHIVGQSKDTLPGTGPNVFWIWDDDTAVVDSYLNWITGVPDSGEVRPPTEDEFRDQIVMRIFQNMNRESSVPEVKAAVKAVLGIDIRIIHTGACKVKLYVPTGTPDWMKSMLKMKTFSYTAGGYNRWYFPFPACTVIEDEIGEY